MAADRHRGVSATLIAGVVRAALVLLGAPSVLSAYETDQYSNRLLEIADSAALLDAIVNEALAEIVAEWPGGIDEERFAGQVYRKLGGLYFVDRIERLVMKSPEIDKLPQRRRDSVYSGAPILSSRVNSVFGVGRTIRVGDTLLGSDKLGHFFSQGLKYYRSYRHGWSKEEIVGRGEYNERWLFGQGTTGVYSNADLVANYEGYLFYRSLFESDVGTGKASIVEWRRGYPVLRRPFEWADHVNDFWDEALNPSWYVPRMARFMEARLSELCEEYRQSPERYVPKGEEALRRRYASLGLKDGTCWRLDRVCAREGPCPDAAEEP